MRLKINRYTRILYFFNGLSGKLNIINSFIEPVFLTWVNIHITQIRDT